MHSLYSFSGTLSAGSYEYFSVLGKSKSYSDTGIQVSGKGDIANGSSIDASLIVFQFVDDLTGPKLRCSRQGSCGKDGIHRIQCVRIFPDHAPHCRTDVHHVRVTLDGHILFHFHGADPADLADIIPSQIHQHIVFGTFLFVCQKFCFQCFVRFLGSSSGSRSCQGEGM